MPLLSYRIEEGRNHGAVDVGTADTTSRFPVMPRVAFDVVVSRWLTVGTAASAGYVRVSSTAMVPRDGPDAFITGIAPRVGALLRTSRHFAFWPRLGVTWVHASSSRPDLGSSSSFQRGLDVDAFAVALPLDGVGITVGYSMALPLGGNGREVVVTERLPDPPWVERAVRRPHYSYLSVGVSAGIVLFL